MAVGLAVAGLVAGLPLPARRANHLRIELGPRQIGPVHQARQ